MRECALTTPLRLRHKRERNAKLAPSCTRAAPVSRSLGVKRPRAHRRAPPALLPTYFQTTAERLQTSCSPRVLRPLTAAQPPRPRPQASWSCGPVRRSEKRGARGATGQLRPEDFCTRARHARAPTFLRSGCAAAPSAALSLGARARLAPSASPMAGVFRYKRTTHELCLYEPPYARDVARYPRSSRVISLQLSTNPL